MKYVLLIMLMLSENLWSQCNDITGQYSILVNADNVKRVAIFKVQVMRLTLTDARNVNFHNGIRIKHDICSNTWIAILTKDFLSKEEANIEKNKWRDAGYADAFVYTEYSYEYVNFEGVQTVYNKQVMNPKQLELKIDSSKRSDTLRKIIPPIYNEEILETTNLSLEKNYKIDYKSNKYNTN